MISLLGVCVCGKYPKLEYWSAMLRVWCKRQPNEISKYNQPKERVFFGWFANARASETPRNGWNSQVMVQMRNYKQSGRECRCPTSPLAFFPPYKTLMVLCSANIYLLPFSFSVDGLVIKKRILLLFLLYIFSFTASLRVSFAHAL